MSLRDDPAWPDLLAEAAAAEQNGSGWGRYGISHEDVEFRSAQEATQPPPDVPDDDAPPVIRETIASLEDAIARAGRLHEPFPAWIGLGLPPEADGFPFPLEVGRYVCLTAFVSASLVPRPALFAAGPGGALMHATISAALAMKGELQRPGEMELLPPPFTCYRIDAVHPDVVVADELGRHWRRTVVQATQVPMEEKRSPRRRAFTPPAARRWRELGPERQALFLGSVWCVSCGAETTMDEPTGRIERGDLVLEGRCRWCGGEVGRVVEGG